MFVSWNGAACACVSVTGRAVFVCVVSVCTCRETRMCGGVRDVFRVIAMKMFLIWIVRIKA